MNKTESEIKFYKYYPHHQVGPPEESCPILEVLNIYRDASWDVMWNHRLEFGFPIVSGEALSEVVSHLEGRPVLEVGAGGGYLAHLLEGQGVDILATDLGDRPYMPEPKVWTEVQTLDGVSAVRDHPHRVVLISWPDDFNQESGWSDQVLEATQAEMIIYLGEGLGECTGSDRFHHLLADKWRTVKRVDLPRWPDMRDDLSIWRRV